MTSDLVRTKLSQSAAIKSLEDLVRVKTSEDVWLLLDASGSMDSHMRNGKRRIDGLREVVAEISSNKEVVVKMIVFNDGEARVSTHINEPHGGTPLHDAISLARRQNAGRAIVVSDGIPDDPRRCLDNAKEFGGRIDVVFVGDPGESGESFLKQLAEATGGTEFHGDLSEPKALGSKLAGLLGSGEDDDEEERKAIQL